MKYEKIKKRFSINNSYFKNRRPQDPSTPLECLDYLVEHGELPYITDHNGFDYNWIYECFIEYQKRTAIKHEQFFTPRYVAQKMAEVFLIKTMGYEKIKITEPFCGYGQITHEMRSIFKDSFLEWSSYNAFDIDGDLIDFACESNLSFLKNRRYQSVNYYKEDFNNIERGQITNADVISNPPYNVKLLTKFLTELKFWLKSDNVRENIAVLLLPAGFVEKQTKAIKEAVSYYNIEIAKKIPPVFAHTKIHTEIVVLTLKKP